MSRDSRRLPAYSIFTPPLDLADRTPRDWRPREARHYFDWFLAEIRFLSAIVWRGRAPGPGHDPRPEDILAFHFFLAATRADSQTKSTAG